MTKKIATIINYCSNDYPFLNSCLSEAKKFSDQIIVVSCDHFFDGEKEDLKLLENDFSKFAFPTFLIYPFILDKIPKRFLKKVKKTSLFPSLSRMVGFSFLEKKIDYVLFLDVDEIVDGDRFAIWLKENSYKKLDGARLANYWYFRSSSSQATMWEDTPVFVKRKKVKYKSLLETQERDAIYDSIKGEKKRMILGSDFFPMVHHYSWVKTKEQMIKKVLSWSHREDKDWISLIEKEFKEKNSKKDFVHGYDLIRVKSFVEIDLHRLNEKKENIKKSDNILCLSEEKLLKIMMKRSLKDYLYCRFLEKLSHRKN